MRLVVRFVVKAIATLLVILWTLIFIVLTAASMSSMKHTLTDAGIFDIVSYVLMSLLSSVLVMLGLHPFFGPLLLILSIVMIWFLALARRAD